MCGGGGVQHKFLVGERGGQGGGDVVSGEVGGGSQQRFVVSEEGEGKGKLAEVCGQ